MSAILILYLFSVGPAFWAWENVFGHSQQVWDLLWTIYHPVTTFVGDSGPLYDSFATWINAWTGGSL